MKNYLPENEEKLSPIDTAFSFMHATVFENQRKSLIQRCERSELRLYFGQKLLKIPKMVNF